MSRTGGGKEVLTTAAVAVVGVGAVAALAGLGLGAALGAGTLLAANSKHFVRRPKPPLRPEEVRRDEQGRIQNWPQLLRAVQHGGIAPELRASLWPLLLGVFPRDSTQQERDAELERLRRLYIKLVLVCRELDAQLQAIRSGSAASSSSGSAASAPAINGGAASAPAAAGSGPGGSMAGAGSGSELNLADSAALSVRSEAGSTATGAAASLPLPGNLAAFAEAHRIIVMDAVRTDLRRSSAEQQPGGAIGGPAGSGGGGGGSPALTVLPVAVGDGLPELMMVSPPEPAPSPASSDAELAAIAVDPSAAAALGGRLPRWCSGLARDMLWGAGHLDDATRAQMLRLVNVLSAYAVHDPETGYCQGMSDLASIFIQLFDDDALAFACFERLMRSARRNFKHDETGIRHQLQQIARVLRDTDPGLYAKLQQLGADDCMFAYRMVVVMLRRELPPAACCTLWEMQWAHEAAEAEAQGAAGGPLGAAAQRAAPPRRTVSNSSESREAVAGGGAGASSSNGSSSGAAAAAAAATAAAGLKSTVQGLSEATASARAGAAPPGAQHAQQAQQQQHTLGRPGSGRERHGGGGSPSFAGGGGGGGAAPAQPPPEFVLQFIAAVVRAQRSKVMGECQEHDDVLRLFNQLQIEFWLAVAQARKQHRAYTQAPAAAGNPLAAAPPVLVWGP